MTVDRKVIKIGGKIYLEAPKGRKQRRTIYPRTTPQGYLCVPRTSSMSCDQAVFVDEVTDAGLFSDVVPVGSTGWGSGFSGAAASRERCVRC